MADHDTVDIEFERRWLLERKAEIDPRTGEPVSWSRLAKSANIPLGTLSGWAGSKYAGRSDLVAERVAKFRKQMERKEALGVGLPSDPGYVSMPTADEITGLLQIAQTGVITMACTGPGTSKTGAVREYLATGGNAVFMMTINPSNKRLAPMTFEALQAVGGKARGASAWMSSQFEKEVQGKKALLMVDEANHLDFESLEQLRSWNDTTGIGICLLGNSGLDNKIRSGKGRHDFGKLASRIDAILLQDGPRAEDLELYLDAWGIEDEAQRNFLAQTGLSFGSGGLRDVTKIIRNASKIASAEGRPLSVAHLKSAKSNRLTRFTRPVL